TLYSSVPLKWLIDSKTYFLGKLSVDFPKSSALYHTFVYLQNRDAPALCRVEQNQLAAALCTCIVVAGSNQSETETAPVPGSGRDD
ncbi:hypothetical protein QUA09_30995, partial [Microcoleus sp. SVA1B1]